MGDVQERANVLSVMELADYKNPILLSMYQTYLDFQILSSSFVPVFCDKKRSVAVCVVRD